MWFLSFRLLGDIPMSEKQQKLGLSLSADEMELLATAARLAGCNDISDWAKEILLETARREAGKTEQTKATKPRTSRPKCTCGATNNPNGECDSSCIMRY